MSDSIGDAIQNRLDTKEAKTLLLIGGAGLGIVLIGGMVLSGQLAKTFGFDTPESGQDIFSWVILGLIVVLVAVAIFAPKGRATKGTAMIVGSLGIVLLIINPLWILGPVLQPFLGAEWEIGPDGDEVGNTVAWAGGGCVAGGLSAAAIGQVPPLTFLPEELISVPAGCILGGIGGATIFG